MPLNVRRLFASVTLVFTISVLILFITSCRGPKKLQTAINKRDTAEVVVVVNMNTAHEDSINYIQTALDAVNAQKIFFTSLILAVSSVVGVFISSLRRLTCSWSLLS